MTDLLHRDIPADYLDEILSVMIAAPQHTFIVLTKRPDRIDEAFYGRGPAGARVLAEGDSVPNLWLGASCEVQVEADWRTAYLSCITHVRPSAVRFVSFEPLLGPVDVRWVFQNPETAYDWAIIGCEKLPGQRPGRECRDEWVRDLVEQHREFGVPVFLKQLVRNGRVESMPELDGRVYDEMPRGVK